MNYIFAIEKFKDIKVELIALMQYHYAEMSERLVRDGFEVSPFDMDIKTYEELNDAGHLLIYTVRLCGTLIGYSNIYITQDMHNSDLMAQEDCLYIRRDCRKGVGKELVKYCLADLKARGMKYLDVTAMTDLRVAKIWKRMGFKELAVKMRYTF